MLLLADGERMPLLLGYDLQPQYYPTLFITSQVRNAGRAVNSISAELGSIKRLYTWADHRKIDLERRLAAGEYLQDAELEDLARFVCERPFTASRRRSGAQLKFREAKLREARIKAQSRYRHLMFLTRYLQWLSERLAEARTGFLDQGARVEIGEMVANLGARKPRKAGSSRLNTRMGLTIEDQKKLVRVSGMRSIENIQYLGVEQRNELIVRLLLDLGIRAGELLALKTDDFDFQKSEVVIQRRPDDPADPRVQQPLVKTCDRRLPVADGLMKLVYAYIMGPRRNVQRARRHKFLLVVHRNGPHAGKPLSAKGLAKLFRRLRQLADLPLLTPHVLRHTANERFSELMDEDGVPEAREEQLRSYAMGWRDGSGTAAAYTRRHIAAKAAEASKKLQEKLNARK
jgi:integrase